MKISTLAMATAGALVCASGASALTNYVSDGNFSSPYGGPSYTGEPAATVMGPWNVTGTGSDAVDLIGGYWQSPTGPGTGSVDLDGTQPGGINQALTLTAGTYTLEFDLSGNPDGGLGSTKTVDVSVGDITNQSFTFITGSNGQTGHSDMGYELERLVFTTTGNTTLSFDSQDLAGSAYGPVIGNVGVFAGAIPEPATWGLMILGLGGIGAAARARRKTALV